MKYLRESQFIYIFRCSHICYHVQDQQRTNLTTEFCSFPSEFMGLILLDLSLAFCHFFYPSLKNIIRNGVNMWFYWLLGYYWGHCLLYDIVWVFFYENSVGKILFNFIIGGSHTSPEPVFFFLKILWSLWIMSLIVFPFLLWLLESSDHNVVAHL